MKKFIAVGFLMFLTACVSVPPHTLEVGLLQTFKLVGVEFKGAENIASWPSEEENFRKQLDIDAQVIDRLRSGSAQNVPEIHAFFAKKLQERFEPSFSKAVAGTMTGTRPVKAVVTVTKLNIPSTAARVLMSNASLISATITIVDAKTSAELLKYEGVASTQLNPGGVSALVLSVTDLALKQENDLISDYFVNYRKWLVKD